jgi:hypothetical protein
MADEEETFVPRSDEDLARVLEEQMAQLRGQTGEVQPLPAAPVQDAPERDAEMDAIFNALLEEEEPEPVAIIAESVTVAAVVETVAEPVTADFKPAFDEDSLAQTVPIDVVPIPSMFTESSSEEAYIAAALAPEVVEAVGVVAVTETVIDQIFEDGTVEETIIEDVTVDGELVEETVIEQIFEQVSDTNATNPVTTFERRPSFDELVFGAPTED